jgi:uncharacterized protein
MSTDQSTAPSFAISHDADSTHSLLAGFSQFGLAGLTAVDYLVDQLDLEEMGHVMVEQLPSITPFENGRPRHHTRMFSRSDLDVTVLVGELFVPLPAADFFCDEVVTWATENEVEEITILSGVPVPHGPEQHRTFYVATDDYRDSRLADAEVPPMGSGYLDGINGGLVERGLDADSSVGVLVTPVHAPAPDVEAAIRLLETATHLYDLDVTTDTLEDFAGEVRQYYADLSRRLEEAEKADQPEDRMYV